MFYNSPSRWPAVISQDPGCGLSVRRDNNGHICDYHVEFLGSEHSHSWCPTKNVQLYGHKDNSPAPSQQKSSQGKVRNFEILTLFWKLAH